MIPIFPSDQAEPVEYDPVFLHARREAILIFVVWVVTLFWVVPFCYVHGYAKEVDPETLRTIWGIPRWVFWGVAVPWVAADIFTVWLCFFYMTDADLGEEGAQDG